MKRLRDRWNEHSPRDDPMAELERLAGLLDDRREIEKFERKMLAEAERAEAEGEAVTVDEFKGVLGFDEADRLRAERNAATVAARKRAERAGELVKVGEKLCDEQARKIANGHHEAAYEMKRVVEADIARREAELAAKRQQLQQLDVEAERWSYYGEEWLKLQALFSPSAQSALLTRELDRQAAQRPPETPEQARERQAATLLGARTVDDLTGQEEAAYVRLPNEGGAVRLR